MLKLSEIIKLAGYPVSGLAVDPDVTGVCDDSRRVSPGDLFVARRGTAFDSHSAIEEVIKSGAVAIVAERPVHVSEGFPLLVIGEDSDAHGRIAHAFFNNPTSRMKVIGVTGTNGKTTTTFVLEAIFNKMGWNPGVIGTIQYTYGDVRLEASNTTPGAFELARLFHQMEQAGVDAVAMEASSHAADQGRIAGIQFDACIATNITQDHLDYHKTMDAYTEAKRKIVDHYLEYSRTMGKPGVAVINIDDERFEQVAAGITPAPVTFSTSGKSATYKAINQSVTEEGSRFEVETDGTSAAVQTHLVGHYNVQNVLGALAAANKCGVSLELCADALQDLHFVPGRLEPVAEGQPFLVLVDYAHTPDALENVLKNAREMTRGKLIVVFGCGGDRDPGKRPLMGQIAVDLADTIVLTNDNPRTEDPEKIADQVLDGILVEGKIVDRILDRREAIERAISYAQPGDTVIIAGKGHEDYQILGTEKIHFDDREIARNYLKGLTV